MTTRRRLIVIFSAAIVIKTVIMAAVWATGGTQTLEIADRIINLGLLVLAGLSIYYLSNLARTRLLWRVRRKLILSYLLVGAVPFLLLIAFSLLGFLLIFFDISSYLVQNRLAAITDEANNLARTTLIEVERTPFADRPDVIARRQAVLETRYPGTVLAMVSTSGNPRCGAPPSKDLPAVDPGAMLPRWVSCRGFAGMLLYEAPTSDDPDHLRLIARAAALPNRPTADYAVLVDLPVDEKSTAESLLIAGIQLGNLSLVPSDTGALPLRSMTDAGDDRAGSKPRSLLNTATFVTYTDWQHGITGRAALSMNVQVGRLYRWLGGEPSRTADLTFSRILLVMLVGIGALLLIIEMVALGNGLALARSITTSVDELFQGTERVKRQDFSHPIGVRSDDQLGELAVSFNEMTSSIEQLLRERGEKRRLEEELRIAREIQMSLLPQGPLNVPGLSVAALCAPAREVGGDYYDFLPLSDGRLGLLIADVSGKGTSAALYMAELKGLMLSLSRVHTSPRALLIEADRIIANHLDNRSFITMIYAIVDTAAGTLTCARAGHTPFIRIPSGGDGDHASRHAQMLAPGGMVLGLNLDKGERFAQALSEVTIPLENDDLFFFFTDGVSEAMDREGDCFGESRMTDVLEAHSTESPEAIRGELLDAIKAFVGDEPQHDDITMIILKVTPRDSGFGIRD